MADGVQITAGSGTTIATDDAGAAGQVQIVKLALSADGSASPITADADGLLVNLGGNNDVTIASGTVSAAGNVGILEQFDLTNSNPAAVAIVDGNGDQITSFGGGTQYTEGDTDASITGTVLMLEAAGNTIVAAPGSAADGLLVNLGANNDVGVTSVVPGTAATNLGKADDAAHTTGDVGVMALGVRQDGRAPMAGTSGDYMPLSLNADGELRVQTFSPGTIDTFGSLITGSVNNAVDVQFYRDTPANLTTVTLAGTGSANATGGMATFSTGASAGGTSKGVSLTSMVYTGGAEVYALFTAAFTGTGGTSTFQRIGLYDADNGFFIGFENTTFGATVRTGAADTQTPKASFNLDTLTGAANSGFTRAGVPEAIDLTKLNVWRIRFGWVGSAPIVFEVLSPDGSFVPFHIVRQPNLAAVPHIEAADLPITCNVSNAAVAATLAVLTNCWVAGTTQRLSKLNAVITDNTLASVERAVITGVTTGGGGGYVNVKVTPSGALTADVAVTSIAAGTNNIGDVDILSIAAGDNNIGNVDIVTMPSVTIAAGSVTANAGTNLNTSALALETGGNLAGAATSLAVMDDWDNGASDGASVSGDVAHDGVDAGEPVKIGARAIAHGTNPTAVAAADRTDLYANRAGVLFTLGGHPNVVTLRANYSSAQTDVAIVTIAGGLKIVVTRCSVTADKANTVDVQCRIGFATTNTPTTTGVVLSHPGIAAGSGVVEGNGAGILGVGADGEDLRITCEAATSGSIDVVVTYFTIES